MSFGDAFMASAEGAQAFTKGEVYIQAYPFLRVFLECLQYAGFPFFARKTLQIPIRYRGVTGVSGAGDIILLN
jgi:hypothetical protein